jgi:hypothetical protein
MEGSELMPVGLCAGALDRCQAGFWARTGSCFQLLPRITPQLPQRSHAPDLRHHRPSYLLAAAVGKGSALPG